MKRDYAFCEECRDEVEYTIIERNMTGMVKGTEYPYTGKEAHCVNCGALIYVPEINDYNLKALYDVYRMENGIVSLEIILKIPKKYAIGKRPLSLMLGWGEQTFSRYCDGDMPTKQYSDILIRIYNEPAYYAELLEAGKRKLRSQASYDKSRKAVNTLLGISVGSETKICEIIQYLLNECEDITPLALQKALYYIQGFYYAFYKKFLFSENCEAWVHGPVYRDIYFQYRDYHFDPIIQNACVLEPVLNIQEKAVCDSVIHYLCCYSGKVLEHFTHSEAPWLSTRGDLVASVPSERIILQETIGKYFEEIKKKYNMEDPRDIKMYAQEMFRCLP